MTPPMTSSLVATLLSLVLAAPASAQPRPGYDPTQLPSIQGKVARYSLSPRGDVDGLILEDNTEVHLPPHLGTQLVLVAKPGDMVTVHGLRARAIPMVQAISIGNDATGKTVTDTAPASPAIPGGPSLLNQAQTAQGMIRTQLHGPRGELNGVLLEDGTIVRLAPPEAQRLAAQLTPGATLFVQGLGISGPFGRVIVADRIGPGPAQLTLLTLPRPPNPGNNPPGPAPPPPNR